MGQQVPHPRAASAVRRPQARDPLRRARSAAGHRVRLEDQDLAVDAAAEHVGELAASRGIVLYRLNPTAGLEEAFFHLTEQSEQPARVDDTSLHGAPA